MGRPANWLEFAIRVCLMPLLLAAFALGYVCNALKDAFDAGWRV